MRFADIAHFIAIDFFQHRNKRRNIRFWLVLIRSIFWLGILLALTMTDYLTRVWRTYG